MSTVWFFIIGLIVGYILGLAAGFASSNRIPKYKLDKEARDSAYNAGYDKGWRDARIVYEGGNRT